jgi:cytochrome c-type biogenesis protein CcmF
VTTSSAPDKDMLTANIEVQRDGKYFATMHPAKWSYRHHEDEPPTSEVDIHKTLGEDLYIVLNGYDSKAGFVNLKVVINPLVDWIWLGFMLLIIGTVIAFLPDRAYALAQAAAKSDKTKAAAAATALLFMVLSAANVNAQEMQRASGDLHMPRNDHERVLMGKLKCMCGCPHGLHECGDECGFAPDRRFEVQQLLDAGKSDDDILKFELAKYGEEVMRIPLDTGYRRLVWVLPVAVLFGAAGVLVMVARRTKQRVAESAKNKEAPTPTVGPDDEYQSRLDDELDELD